MLSGADAVEAGGNITLRGYVGQRLRIHGLTSARGLEINGKLADCEGFDPFPEARLHMRVPGFDKVFKVKYANIQLPDTTIEEPGGIEDLDLRDCTDVDPALILRLARTRVDSKTVRQGLQSAATAERPDMKHRANELLACLAALEGDVPSSARTRFECGEVGPHALGDRFVQQMMQMKPGCVGNGKFSLHDLHMGGVDNRQAARRLAEFPMSGFCVKCQMEFLEGAA
jgi:hypothetical protein